ncbi:MAG: FAD-binding domain-containing protein [Acidimicrobiales bacterium]
MRSLNIFENTEQILNNHFTGLHAGGGRSSIPGGQSAADQALAQLDITGYAKRRSQVFPQSTRGATGLSPYIRHNLLTLPQLWKAVRSAPYEDKKKFQDELLWQEYTRHLYARMGTRLFQDLRFTHGQESLGDGWAPGMACVDTVVEELETEGWLVNQSRMWLASHWSVRNQIHWRQGQERMFKHLLDGSRAANLAGWQWTVGTATGKPYGFARWQVESRAPGVCKSCPLKKNCPIEEFADIESPHEASVDPLLFSDPDLAATTGPVAAYTNRPPEVVLLTIDSLGDSDPAFSEHPELPVAFVFNEAALSKLQLSSKRIIFYIETLRDLAERRETQVYLGNPYEFARQNNVAVTYAPVPSFAKFTDLAELHPYPWLRRPHAGSLQSFSAWRKKLKDRD